MNFDDNSNSLFNDEELDEMQKYKNYEIGFKLFRNFLAVVLLASFIIYEVSSERFVIAVSGALTVLAMVFYLIYAARAAKLGVMNLKFAKGYSKSAVIPMFSFMILLYAVLFVCGYFETFGIRTCVMWITIFAANIILSVLAKKNMRAVSEQLKEDESNG